MAEEEDYYSDDLDLLEEHDLLNSDSQGDYSSSDESQYGGGHRNKASASRISSDEEQDQGGEMDEEERLAHLKTIVLGICSALGGYEEVVAKDGSIQSIYQLGDDCLGCLRDLRKLWRKDDEDPSRSIARVFAQVNVLHNDLVPILLQTAGKGGESDKVALACTDLLTALTWPVDAAAEIHDAVTKDNDLDQMNGLPELERAQIQYKSSILRLRAQNAAQDRDVLSVILRYILLPSLSKPRVNRSERDIGVIGMCLHLFRNLLAIRDPIATSLSSSDTLANASLQSSLIVAMHKHHILDTLAMLASSSDAADFNPWNSVTAECIYHIFVGSKVKSIANFEAPKASLSELGKENQGPERSASVARVTSSSSSFRPPTSSSALASSLAAEAKLKRVSTLSHSSTRHSRFGTTIHFVGPDGQRRVARSQAALTKSVGQLTDEAIRKGQRRFRRRKVAQERGAPRQKAKWTAQAARILQSWADNFLQTGFETLSKSVLKDIRSEREKMGDLEVARIRVMQLGTFFLDYFLLRRAASLDRLAREGAGARKSMLAEASTQEMLVGTNGAATSKDVEATAPAKEPQAEEWPFSLVAEWLEPWAFRMVLVRSIQAQESKMWLEFVSSVQLWNVLLRLVDQLSQSKKEEERDAAEGLQAQLYYLSDTLEACHMIVRSYTTQSFACLDAIISFAHVMPRMLERYSSNRDHMYVKAKKFVRKSRQDGSLDHAEDEAAQVKEQVKDAQKEREFKFNDFQRKIATRQLANACIVYLSRWREFTDVDDQLSKLVSVMHRIAIKANDYRQFFSGIYRSTFREILSGDAIKTLEAQASSPARDLKKLMDYVLRKFSKLTPEEQSLYDIGKRPPRPPRRVEDTPLSEIKVKPGWSLEEQIGIAVGLLLEQEKMQVVLWVKSGLEMASAMRTELLLRHQEKEQRELENPTEVIDGGEVLLGNLARKNESPAELFEPYNLSHNEDEVLRRECSVSPEVKLLCRLVGLEMNVESEVWQWSVPKRILPEHLDERISTIERYIREPFDAQGEPLKKLVQRVRKPRESVAPDTDGLNSAGLPGGLDGSDSEEDGDFFDRLLLRTTVADGDQEGEEGSSATQRRRRRAPGGAPRRRGPRKQKRWSKTDFIEDSDDEFAFAMEQDENDEAVSQSHLADAPVGHDGSDEDDILGDDSTFMERIPPSRRPPSAVYDSDAETETDNDDDEQGQDTPPTSSDSEIRRKEARKDVLDVLRSGRNANVSATSTQVSSAARRPKTKRLFLSHSDDELDLISTQESMVDTENRRGTEADANDSSAKRRRLIILDEEDDE